MLEITNLSKFYGKKKVLDQIHLSLPLHQTSIFLGQSGCGKSTLLRQIIGLEKPDEGSVSVDGISPHQIVGRQKSIVFGYVTQKPSLFPHLSAYKNMSIVTRLHGWSPEQAKERVDELCELTRVPSSLLQKYPSQLSGGQAQRLNLLRALLMNPPYLLLDEPLSALDPINRSYLQRDLHDIFCSLKKTVLFVTHDLQEAKKLGSRIYLMKEGKIEQEGDFQEIKQNPKSEFVREFVHAQSL